MRYKTYRRKLARAQLGLVSACFATHYDRCPASGRTTTLGVDELTNRRGSPVVNVSMMWKTLGGAGKWKRRGEKKEERGPTLQSANHSGGARVGARLA